MAFFRPYEVSRSTCQTYPSVLPGGLGRHNFPSSVTGLTAPYMRVSKFPYMRVSSLPTDNTFCLLQPWSAYLIGLFSKFSSPQAVKKSLKKHKHIINPILAFFTTI